MNVHAAAGRGNLAEVMYAFQLNSESVLVKDGNGWQPLHEAVRGGYLPIVKFLLEEASADINARTGRDGMGASPLWWALKYHNTKHPVVVYLKDLDAISIAPDEVWPPENDESTEQEEETDESTEQERETDESTDGQEEETDDEDISSYGEKGNKDEL